MSIQNAGNSARTSHYWYFPETYRGLGYWYLGLAVLSGLIILAVYFVIRAEMLQPGLQIFRPKTFNMLAGIQKVLLMFFIWVPLYASVCYLWVLPSLVKRKVMRLRKINNFFLYVLIALVVIYGLSLLLFPEKTLSATTGWTFYSPLSKSSDFLTFNVFAIHICFLVLIITIILVKLSVILKHKEDNKAARSKPVFAVVLALVLVSGGFLANKIRQDAEKITLLLTDKYFGTSFFNAIPSKH